MSLSDAFGISGQRILKGLLEPVPRSAGELAQLAKGRLRAKLPELTASLEGHRLTDHDRWMIRQSIEHLKFLEQQLSEIGQELLVQLQPFADEYQLLQTIPGVKEDTAAVILAETGGDMAQFATPADLASWAGLAPGNHISAGKRKKRGRKRGNRWLRGALAQSAQAAAKKKDSLLKPRFYRWQKRIGKPKAMVAMSRKLLTIVWHILTTRQPYTEPDPVLRRKQERDDQIQHHIRRLRQLGVQIPQPDVGTDDAVAPLKRTRPRTRGALGFHAR
jgi:transposase